MFGEARAQDPIWHHQAYAAQQQAAAVAAQYQAQANAQKSTDTAGKDTSNIVVEKEEEGEENAEGSG